MSTGAGRYASPETPRSWGEAVALAPWHTPCWSTILVNDRTAPWGFGHGATRTEGPLRLTWRRSVRGLAQAVLPGSVVAWHGQRTRPRGSRRPIALTFDDGPNELTHSYLDALRRFRARATFFLVGEQCAHSPGLVSAIAAEGHQLAGHGYTHRRFPSLSPDELRRELAQTAALLPRPSGRPLVRPPHGAMSPSSLLTCVRAGFTTVLWSHDSGDWCTTSANDVCSAFENDSELGAGAVVLLHEGQPWTLQALPRVLGKLHAEGHELVTLGELLG